MLIISKFFKKSAQPNIGAQPRRGGFPRPPEQILILNKPNDEPQYRRGELRSPADGQGCPSLLKVIPYSNIHKNFTTFLLTIKK